MLDGFRKFVLRGNVVDLAVGVIIGAAFSAIVKSMVEDVVTPLIGMAGGAPDFSSLKLGPVKVGNFVNALANFLIQAGVLYFVVVVPINKLLDRMGRTSEAPPLTADQKLLTEIRDLLKAPKN
ncbi:MAG: large conductance mechanosensitive channel protein MscL [Alphaproteobacteria bacterium]|nr:large conductance mechanosensitive channel protein MscL [Alphaproteobacteria bacterium]MBV8549173.1 large conductance mechanosensitive channel protein MscL [Alphaproteobacteria bacterium]